MRRRMGAAALERAASDDTAQTTRWRDVVASRLPSRALAATATAHPGGRCAYR